MFGLLPYNKTLESIKSHKHLLKSFIYGYGHIAIFAGIAATGVGIKSAIETASEATRSAIPLPLFYGAAMALIGLTGVHSARSSSLPLWSIRLRLVTAALAIAITIFNPSYAIAICFVLPLLTTVLLEERYLANRQ